MRDKTGTILIFTTWILLTLTILSIIVASRASSQLNLAKYEIEELQSTYLAKAAVNKMIVGLIKDRSESSVDTLKEDWNRSKTILLEGKEVLYSATDEERRLNLNGNITEETLIPLSPDLTSDIAKEIIEYKNKRGRLDTLEELFLIEDMTGEIFQDIRDYLTVYSSDNKININTASRQVLKAIGITYEDADWVLSYREGQDGEDGTEDDNVFKALTDVTDLIGPLDSKIQQQIGFSSQIFRILIEAKLLKNRTKRVETILNRDTGKILSWKEGK